VRETLQPAIPTDVLEFSEMWSYVGKKSQKKWLWIALCRRTRQIVAFALGDRSEKTCQSLFEAIPEDYKKCKTYSDFWEAYLTVFPPETLKQVGKETGQTAHVERWNNTLRQRSSRYIRKTLSFSKSETLHELVSRWFIVDYNLHVSLTN
jgi:IS1 family transposase